MVNLLRVNRPVLKLLWICVPIIMQSAAGAPNLIADKPSWDATSMVLDGPNNTMVLTEVRITTQSGYTIKAGQARTTDVNNFNNSKWTFSNKVQISTPNGSSSAETAIVTFADNQISTLHVTGNPATFEQHVDNKTVAQGHAENIDYDLSQQTVRLSNNAWVSYGQNECRAVSLVYNITLQRVSANREEQKGQRINCTISPTAGNTSSSSTAP